MDRVWKSGAAGSPPSAAENTSSGYATSGDGSTTAPTKPGAYMWHMLVEEIMSVIAAGGITPDKTDVGQLLKALKGIGLMGGLSGGGIGQLKFPASQNASSDANTLDDFEEGTWTPVIGGSGGTSGQTYLGRDGRYVKVGRVVFAPFGATFSAKGTITGVLQLQGLPFSALASATHNLCGCDVLFSAMVTSLTHVFAYPVTGTSTANIAGIGAAGVALTSLTGADVGNGSTLHGALVYLTDN